MSRGKRGSIVAAVALLAVLIAGFAGYSVLRTKVDPSETTIEQPNSSAEVSEEEQKPLLLADFDATVYTESGDPITLSQIANGRPLVVNLWATWCPYCVQEMPDFAEAMAREGDKVSFAFIDVTDGKRETKEGATEWLAENGFEGLPVYFDEDLAAARAFGARSLPTSVFVSSEGEILGIRTGVVNAELLQDVLSVMV